MQVKSFAVYALASIYGRKMLIEWNLLCLFLIGILFLGMLFRFGFGMGSSAKTVPRHLVENNLADRLLVDTLSR